MSEVNPYRTPESVVEDPDVGQRVTKATRGSRLAAALLDGVVMFPGALLIGFGADENDPNVLLIALGSLIILALLGYLCYLVYSNGQTIGKKMMTIKVVRVDGSRASFPRILFLRNVAPGMIGAIPLLGTLFSLVDILFIFREDQRCIHDMFADTIVIQA